MDWTLALALLALAFNALGTVGIVIVKSRGR
jgi:hypothetical protein